MKIKLEQPENYTIEKLIEEQHPYFIDREMTKEEKNICMCGVKIGYAYALQTLAEKLSIASEEV